MVDTLVVLGLALEIAGAALLAGEVLTRDPAALARRAGDGGGYGPPPPQVEHQRNAARAVVGFVLLAVGFLAQIVSYAVECPWFAGLAAVVVVVAYFGGRSVAEVVARWLNRRAGG